MGNVSEIYFILEDEMKKLITICAVVVTILAITACAANAAYIEDFEGADYNFYADPGCTAKLTTAQAHSGNQSAEFILDATHFAYTRWKSIDISSYGFTVNDIIASGWVKRTFGRSDLTPYFLFTVETPDTSQETLAIQFIPGFMIQDNVWTQNVVDRNTTTFHVVGDRTGLGEYEFRATTPGTQDTLDALAAHTYSGTTLWGDFTVSYVRVGVGLWDASQAYTGYLDDVVVVPEPTTICLLGLGVFGLLRKRR
jgi:hypothetical protein